MHFWGLTVDVISAVDIIIAIGLCVDYAGAFFFLQTFVVSWIWPEPSHPSAHLPRLLDRVRKQKRESSRGLGWHGPCCPQWRPLHPHRLHPPPQQRLLLFPHLLQDLLPYCTIWGLARPSSSPSPLVFGWTWRLQLCQVQWKKNYLYCWKFYMTRGLRIEILLIKYPGPVSSS